jgi:hypothetical protein
MRLPNAAHESHPWRIREIAPDFTLEDVWALPEHGGAKDFQTALEMMTSSDPANAELVSRSMNAVSSAAKSSNWRRSPSRTMSLPASDLDIESIFQAGPAGKRP